MFGRRGILVAGFGLLLSVSAQASIISGVTDCALGGCTWSMTVLSEGSAPVRSGTYTINPRTGAITFGSPVRYDIPVVRGGGFVQLTSLSGNADPILGFNASAGTGAGGNTFSFSFSLPIALSGPIGANSSISYSLTSLTSAGAQIDPLNGKVAVAQEVDTTPGGLTPLNKGVNVGDRFFFLGGPQTQNSPVYTASNVFVGNLAYDLMSVTVAFSLSPNSNVGLSGFVQQTVPVPAAVWLLGSALGVLGWIRRKSIS